MIYHNTSILLAIISLFLSEQVNHSQFNNKFPLNEMKDYTLVWQDEFTVDGPPNPEFWSFEKGFVRNEELQFYQEDNAEVKDGKLIITGRREAIKNPKYEEGYPDWRVNREYSEYTSSSIKTSGKKLFQYGIFEVRARIDTALGMWPAIWTLGESKPWPANGEIDMMEYYRVNGEGTILANAAWASPDKRAAWDEVKVSIDHFIEQDPHWPEKFHIWKMDWTETYIRLYLDDELLNEVDLTKTINPDGFNPFHQPHYVLLSLAIGSNGGDPSSTTFPKTFEVDYVRVYQKN